MKRTAIISLLALMLVVATGTAFAQQQQPRPAPRPTPAGPPEFGLEKKNCPCNIVGTWKAQLTKNEARLYEFDGEGTVKVLTVAGNAKPTEVATAKYEFVEEALPMEAAMAAPEQQKEPDKKISFTATGKNRIFGRTNATMKIVSYDDSFIT